MLSPDITGVFVDPPLWYHGVSFALAHNIVINVHFWSAPVFLLLVVVLVMVVMVVVVAMLVQEVVVHERRLWGVSSC